MLSIIIPVLNEAELIVSRLQRLQPLREQGNEIIVVDGGSKDGTVDRAKQYTDKLVSAEPGRASQMNAGASIASGDIYLFLHIDTILPDVFIDNPELPVAKNSWGFFRVQLDGNKAVFRMIETCMNLRACITSIGTGDQALFINSVLFNRIGGFPAIELMEDVAICKLLRVNCKPVCISSTVTTSSRRWEQKGIARTILLMWSLRLLYFLGVSPRKLSAMYGK